MMKFFRMTSGDVYTNLATEEYMFRNFRDDTYFLLWDNDSSIVVGKNQNVFQEINIPMAEREGIKIARRITGGGTVFHDAGNLNYSILMNHDPDTFSYDQCLSPVICTLNSMGVPAHKRRTSDIAIEGKKISGSAQTIGNGRVLHHGTLLFDADLNRLNELLQPMNGSIQSRATASVPSPVTNIANYLKPGITMTQFKKMFVNILSDGYAEWVLLSEEDRKAIYKLRDEKYLDWDWNYGRSPEFTYEHNENGVRLNMRIKKGRILNTEIHGIEDGEAIASALLQVPFGHKSVRSALAQARISDNQIDAVLNHIFQRGMQQ